MVVLLLRQSSYDVRLLEASKLALLRSLASELTYEYLDDIDIHGGIYKPILNKYNQTINLSILYSKQL